MLALDPKTTALVLIDLQKGIVNRPLAPHSGPEVISRAKKLAEKFRAGGAPVILVKVAFAPDFADAPSQATDEPMRGAADMPADWAEYVEGLQAPGDLTIVKRQWGAFYGTELELQLRRRGVGTIVLGGVATNFGVESTARQAWELGYAVVIAEDLCATHTKDMHAFAVEKIFPRLSRVCQSADLALEGTAD